MADLVNYQICVGNSIAQDEWSPFGKGTFRQMALNCIEVSNSIAFLMRWIGGFFVRIEKRGDEKSPPWHNCQTIISGNQ